MIRALLIGLTALLLASKAASQSPWRQDIVVRHGSDTLRLAWTGGLNAPQVSGVQWGGGLLDLLVHDRADGLTLALEAVGPGRYRWLPELSGTLPPYRPTRWMVLADADADGDADLWCDTTGAAQLWINLGGGRWHKRYPLLTTRFNSGSGPITIPAFVGPADLPSVRDVDGDGDVDLLAWNPAGGVLLSYYKNFAVEDLGRADTIHFAQASECWGRFIEQYDLALNLYTIQLNYTVCVPREFKRAHEGGTLLALNLNGDSLSDVLVSDAGVPYIYALTNGGSRRFAQMVTAEGFYPSVKPVMIAGGPGLFYADATGDGTPDLLAAPNDPLIGPDQASLWRYRNTGTAAQPTWTFEEEDFLQRDMIDVGTGSAPCLADVTGDGLSDLIVAAGSRWDGTVNGPGRLRLYRNVGSATAPAFALESDDYLGLSTQSLRELAPTAADLDADGDLDLVIGAYDPLAPNGLRYYRNEAARGAMADYRLVSDDFAGAKALGYLALAPHAADLDADGDLDLVIGHALGQIVVLPNEGNARNPVFGRPIRNWGGINVGTAEDGFVGFARPLIADVTGDGRADALVGSANGSIRLYTDVRLRPTGSFGAGVAWLGLDAGRRSAPTAGLLHSNDSLTVLVGTLRGGLLQLRVRGRLFSSPGPEAGLTAYVYPNPARDEMRLVAPADSRIRIYDVLGRLVRDAAMPPSGEALLLDVSRWPTGLYLAVVESPSAQVTLKLVVR